MAEFSTTQPTGPARAVVTCYRCSSGLHVVLVGKDGRLVVGKRGEGDIFHVSWLNEKMTAETSRGSQGEENIPD